MNNFIGILVIVLVLAGIGILAYFKLRKETTATGKVATVSPKVIKVNDNKTKKDIIL